MARPHECPHGRSNVHTDHRVCWSATQFHPVVSKSVSPTFPKSSEQFMLLCVKGLHTKVLPWAQGVGRSNRPAPTNDFSNLQVILTPCKIACSRFCSCRFPAVSSSKFRPRGAFYVIRRSDLKAKTPHAMSPTIENAASSRNACCASRKSRLWPCQDHWTQMTPARREQREGHQTPRFLTGD
jgi:hypothetical protein